VEGTGEATTATRPRPRLGATIDRWEIVGERREDEVVVRDATGDLHVLALGHPAALEREAQAIEALSDRLVLPQVVARGSDPQFGAYLVLDVRLVEDPRPTLILDQEGVLAALGRVLEVARVIEAAGLSWMPRPGDLAAGGAAILRLRGVTRRAPRGRLDARLVVEGTAPAIVGDPPILPPELLRVVLPRRTSTAATIEDLEKEIAVAVEQARAVAAAETPSPVGAWNDLGLHRDRDEDAVRVWAADADAIAVVCDGISSSVGAAEAANTAAETTLAALVGSREQDDLADAVRAAIAAANAAVCEGRKPGTAPGTTLVAARVRGLRAAIGWVGDSRAYFVGEAGAQLLTSDHSWLGEAIASGGYELEEALASPHAHALTRCLGPLDGDGDHARPDVVEVALPGPGHLVLCTDGFWSYAPGAEDLAALFDAVRTAGSSQAIARSLVATAIARGGHDNVGVAVVAVPV
jgi:serine/threonine protein phosphatase PrpC